MSRNQQRQGLATGALGRHGTFLSDAEQKKREKKRKTEKKEKKRKGLSADCLRLNMRMSSGGGIGEISPQLIPLHVHCSSSWFELDQWYVFRVEALVAHPLGIHLTRQQVVCTLCQSCADPMEPEVAPRLTEDSLIVVMDLLVADPARVDRRSIGVLGIEDHRLS